MKIRYPFAVVALVLIVMGITTGRLMRPAIGRVIPATAINAPTVAGQSSAPAGPVRGDPVPSSGESTELPPAGASEAFWHATDYYTFIREHAQRAFAGNARAAYYIKAATRKCADALELHRVTGEPLMYKECARLATDDPFVDLPPRADGYPWMYWQERAISAGDPLALMQVAFEEQQTPVQQQAAIAAAARSGDPEAYFYIGLFMHRFGGGFEDTVGWQLVACDLGYDCRMSNPRVGHGCVERGFCQAEQTLEIKVRDEVGAWTFSKAEKRAEEILSDLSAGRVPVIP